MEEKLRRFIQAAFPDALIRETNFRGELSFYIKPDALVAICGALMNDPDLEISFLADVTSVDWYNHSRGIVGRFEVIYNLYSLKNKFRFFLKVHLPEDKPEIQSLTPLWNGANWMEREVWDLMGIVFVGHPELVKILTADELDGHPLRRDFPLTYEVPHFSWNKNNPPEVIR